MDRSYAIVTALGQAMIAEAIRTGADINLTAVAIGDADYHPLEGQTALMNERARVSIIEISRDQNNPAWLRIMSVLPPTLGGWNMWEAGIFAENGNLFAIARLDGAYKPVYADDNYAKEVALDIILEVSSAANVNLVADPNVIIATRQWVQNYVDGKIDGMKALHLDHINNFNNPHKVSAAQLGVYLKTEVDGLIVTVNNFISNQISAVTSSLSGHISNLNNPHKVSAAQLGVYLKTEVDGLITTVNNFISNQISGVTSSLNSHTGNFNNPHKVTAAQLGVYLKTEVDQKFAALEKMSWNLVTSVWPKSIPLPFFGAVAEVPAGWAVCDGSNGTKDLRNKFIVGAGGKYNVNSTGGAETHSHTASVTVNPTTLTVNQMPAHNHTIQTPGGSGSGWFDDGTGYHLYAAERPTSSTGGGQSHTHGGSSTVNESSSLPPYYAMIFIQRIS